MTEPLPSDLAGIELALASLSPADVSMTRDELMFAAGARRAHSRARTAQRVWQGMTAAVALVSIGAIVVIASSMPRWQPGGGGIPANSAAGSGDADNTPTDLDGTDQQRAAVGIAAAQESDTVVGKPIVATHEPSPTMAFSRIGNVNGWSTEELHEVGITIKPWLHELQSEDPPLDWVEIAFDCSPLPKEQEVLMTAWFIPDSRLDESVTRTQRGKMHEDSVSLLLAVRDNYRTNSYVTILIWSQTPGVGSEAHGYQLSMQRIMELAKEASADAK